MSEKEYDMSESRCNQSPCNHANVYRHIGSTGKFLDKWSCGCGTEFFHLDLRSGKTQVMEPAFEPLTLRDQFALAALTGILAGWGSEVDTWPNGSVERLAYVVAGEMMKERARGKAGEQGKVGEKAAGEQAGAVEAGTEAEKAYSGT